MLEWAKRHPYLAGGAVLAIIALIYLMRRSSSTSSTSASATSAQDLSLQSLEVQAGLQGASIQAQYQLGIAQVNAANADTALQSQAAITQSQLQAQVQTQQILSTTDTTNNTTGAELALGLVQAGYNPIFTADLAGFHFGGTTPGSNPSIPTPPTPQPIGQQTVSPEVTLQASQQNNGISAAIVASANGPQIQIPAGAFSLAGPNSATPSQALTIPTPFSGETYQQYHDSVITGNCSPFDFQCIANNQERDIALNQQWTAFAYGQQPTAGTPVPTTPSAPSALINSTGGLRSQFSGPSTDHGGVTTQLSTPTTNALIDASGNPRLTFTGPSRGVVHNLSENG